MKDVILNIGWRLVMPFVKTYYRICGKNEFNKGSYISYPSRFNGHNHVGRNSYVLSCELGYGASVANDSYLFNTRVGKFTCIGPRVATVCGRHPIEKFVSIHPAFFSKRGQTKLSYVGKQLFEEYRYADEKEEVSVIIGNDVWIGADAKVMEGITIGDGAVIAAGAMVLQDVEPYTIVAGIPAKVKKYRFEKEEREWLMQFQWWDKPEKWIKKHADIFSDIKKMMEQCI